MKVGVCGAGSWGTALAAHLVRGGNEVCLWGRDREVLTAIQSEKRNPRYLPQVILPDGLCVESELAAACSGKEVVLYAVPTHATRELAKLTAAFVPRGAIVISTAKGLEEASQKRMSEVLSEELGGPERVAILSGPSFALEVAKGLPTAVTMASSDPRTLEAAVKLFHFDTIRVYGSSDVIGVELGGAIKNVIALAAGIVDGMELGLNARAALITRGLAEMKRLIESVGGSPLTVMGLSGLGDLLLTATGDLSRNRTLGVSLGRGEPLDPAVANLGQVAEGVRAARQVLVLATNAGIEMPIVREVARLIAKEVTPQQAVKNLLLRPPQDELKLL